MENLFLIFWVLSFSILLIFGLYNDIYKRGKADKVNNDKGAKDER